MKINVHKDKTLSKSDILNKINHIWNNDDDIKRYYLTLIEGMPRYIDTCTKGTSINISSVMFLIFLLIPAYSI